MSAVASQGKRAGPRRAARPAHRIRPALLGLATAITLCVVAWGYLVFTAIDFGVLARSGQTEAWWFLGMSSLGAAACLFLGLILIGRLTRELGVTAGPERPAGGKRAARTQAGTRSR